MEADRGRCRVKRDIGKGKLGHFWNCVKVRGTLWHVRMYEVIRC